MPPNNRMELTKHCYHHERCGSFAAHLGGVAGREVAMTGKRSAQWSWRELPVDPAQDHLELRFGSGPESAPGASLLVARVGRPVKRVFTVEWLVSPAGGRHRDVLAAVTKDLDYYLVSKGETNPWRYAQYHSGSAANLYSRVNWTFCSGRAVSASNLDSLGRLDDVGFRRCGSWSLVSGKPVASVDAEGPAQGLLYAFVSVRDVLYVGKTNRPLRSRMRGYQRPGPTQRTNAAVHVKISQLLASQRPLDIFAFAAPDALRRGTFEVNLAAGLEDAIIRDLQPPWNHVGK